MWGAGVDESAALQTPINALPYISSFLSLFVRLFFFSLMNSGQPAALEVSLVQCLQG